MKQMIKSILKKTGINLWISWISIGAQNMECCGFAISRL
jgi:hypothetical protein